VVCKKCIEEVAEILDRLFGSSSIRATEVKNVLNAITIYNMEKKKERKRTLRKAINEIPLVNLNIKK